MSAAFTTPDRGDSSVNEAKTSDTPQFDLRTIYSDMNATARGGSANKESSDQLDFGPSDIYARINNNESSNNSFNFEQQGAMQMARHFASFDDNQDDRNNDLSFDREDAGRLIEVYGDMFNAQQAIQEGDRSEARDWFGEMRRDLNDFARGLFESEEDQNDRGHRGGDRRHDGDDEGRNEECPEHSCPADETEHGSEHKNEESEHGNEESEHGNEESEHGSEEGSKEGSEPCPEHGSEGEGSGDHYIDTGSEGYSPEDSMVLLQNDLEELSEALASGDTKAIQKILARMSRHMSLLMRQLGQNEEAENPGRPGDSIGGDTGLPTPPRPGDILNGIPNPGDVFPGLPALPNPGDFFPNLPTPPNPGEILDGLPSPGDLFDALPKPPNPGDFFDALPTPPNPGDIFNNLPKPPNPSDLLNDIFDIF